MRVRPEFEIECNSGGRGPGDGISDLGSSVKVVVSRGGKLVNF